MIKVKHNFADIDLMMTELSTVISHYRNERIYRDHRIYFNGTTYEVKFDIYG